MATKIEAIKGRASDLRMSHDFEDLIYVYSNTNDINNVIQQSHIKLPKYLISEFKSLYSKNIFKEDLIALSLMEMVNFTKRH